MRSTVFIISALLLIGGSFQTNIFNKFLEMVLMPDRAKFRLSEIDPIHRETAKKMIEIKEDGLGILYTLIYYNLMLNLERECFFVVSRFDQCDHFVTHMQSVVKSHVRLSDKDYKIPLIGQLYKSIFDLETVYRDKEYTLELRATLGELKTHFEGERFRKTREALINTYNDSLKSIVDYLNSKSDQPILHLASIEIQNQDNVYIRY
jgi:hypothetical protein